MLRFLVVLLLLLVSAAPADAQLPQLPGTAGPSPGAYRQNDAGGFRDILPPRTRGRYNAVELAAFLAAGRTVPHCCDQLGMYRDLVYATPGLTAAQIPSYFKDSSFGVPPGQAERSYSPRSDVTIVRDKAFGVPHVYGKTRDGAMFGLGYAGAEDLIHWINRPTFQQANEIRSQVPR
jgi:Penicillin amidase